LWHALEYPVENEVDKNNLVVDEDKSMIDLIYPFNWLTLDHPEWIERLEVEDPPTRSFCSCQAMSSDSKD